jgi:Fic-DOC domain mobile mystery protein B
MNDPLGPQHDGGTPLTEEEKEGLIPSYITLRRELNEAEQENILEAQEWAFARKRDVLDEKFLKELHRRMYRHVWQWAGEYRKTAKNVGDVDAYRIPTKLRGLLDDCRHWIEHETYEPDEIATRFHHRLVFIHCYPNGNGRHARMATDLFLRSAGCEPFSWGCASLTSPGETRDRYMAALRAADKHDYGPLLKFVRS